MWAYFCATRNTNILLLKWLQKVYDDLSTTHWAITTIAFSFSRLRTRQLWHIQYCTVITFLTSVSSLNCSMSTVWVCWNMPMSISSPCCVYVHFSHQRGTWAGPHVNQSTRGRLFSREIIIVRDVRRWSRLIIFFLPCRAVKRGHSKKRGDTKADTGTEYGWQNTNRSSTVGLMLVKFFTFTCHEVWPVWGGSLGTVWNATQKPGRWCWWLPGLNPLNTPGYDMLKERRHKWLIRKLQQHVLEWNMNSARQIYRPADKV